MTPTVVKVGGSLFDLPDLGDRLRRWLDRHAPPEVILVPGGGPTTDVVRDLDRTHRLGEEASHWLALRALTLNAAFLADLLAAEVVGSLAECVDCWRRGRRPVLDVFAVLRADEARPDHLPHAWAAGSDSVAARVAVLAGARELVLLKSADAPAGPWAGYVDEGFGVALGRGNVRVTAVNLRTGR
jgi:aspartokinase-like uncharacterized kinase